ncbi:glycoside hydrolase family 25 protein [Streptomyces sp. NRRL F-5123]|uniref:glycoside hydrolase family 25 protein n=1 Tax=Streptomyces sp. NRRL F-5123 TaxID=1463856 RepID=UPI0007C4F237|nr:GH25 family lysozyme [Streptomyces sp. NRRL F-5123]
MTIKGQDWSSHQVAEPSTAGLSFVIIKATEGTSYTSPNMTKQTAHARKNGLLVGFYHFLRPGDMAKQAAYFVAKAASVEGDTFWADWEDPKVSCADKDAFLAEVKRLRPTHRVGLYCSRDFWVNHDHTSVCGDALWIAQYNGLAGAPNIEHAWVIDQWTSTPVDTDVANFVSKAAMETWQRALIPKPAAPAPAKPKPAPAKPAAKPVVSLAHFLAAQKADSKGKQGHTTYTAEALVVEKALRTEGLLAAQYVDGSAGTKTRVAYAAYQRRLGYKGKDADGYAGLSSLKALGKKHGFGVKA